MVKTLIIPTKVKQSYWIQYIKSRIRRKKNFLCLISGPTGSGKSWTALSIASKLDENFGPHRIVFGFENMMKLINEGEKELKAGSVIMWDEFQIDAGNRSWQSLTNKLLNSLLSTFRHKNLILLITSPYADFIDSHSRKLLHAEFEITNIDFENKKTRMKPLAIQYNSRFRKFFYKYLRVKTERGIAPVKSWKVDKPPQWLVDDYERMKNEFTTDLNKSIEKQLEEMKGKKTQERKPLTVLQETAMKLMSKYENSSKVSEEMGLTVRTVNFHISQSRNKGYTVEEFGEKGVSDDNQET